MVKRCFIALALALLSACTTVDPGVLQDTAEERGPRATLAAFESAWQTGDRQAYSALHAQDHVSYQNIVRMQSGRQPVVDSFKGAIAVATVRREIIEAPVLVPLSTGAVMATQFVVATSESRFGKRQAFMRETFLLRADAQSPTGWVIVATMTEEAPDDALRRVLDLESTLGDLSGPCTPPQGWEEVADVAESRVLMFGEGHGTNEAPAAFTEYVCAAAARGGRTVVGLELGDALNIFEDAAASERPLLMLIVGMEARWRSRDGRGSIAMLRMLQRLAALKRQGMDITVLPFDEADLAAFAAAEPSDLDSVREQWQADQIAAIHQGADRTIVLVGEIHAMKARPENIPSINYDLAAMRLPEPPISIAMTHGPGTAFYMLGNDGKERTTPGSAWLPPSGTAAGTMAIWDGHAPLFDGYLHLGGVTASPPVLEQE